MSDSQGKDKHNTFWTVLGALLAIFGAAFAIVTYVVPVESVIEKLALSLVVVSVSILIFRAIQVLLVGKRIDPLLSVLTFVTVGLMVWYTVLLVASREAKIKDRSTRTAGQHDRQRCTYSHRGAVGFTFGARFPTRNGEFSRAEQHNHTSTEGYDPSEVLLPSFAPSAEEVLSTGTATLHLGGGLDLYDWTNNFAGGGDIVLTEAALVGSNKTQLALLTEGSDTSFVACRDHTAWTPAINRQQVRRGSFACLRTAEGRRGILRVDTISDFNKDSPSVVLTGRIWARIVDR